MEIRIVEVPLLDTGSVSRLDEADARLERAVLFGA